MVDVCNEKLNLTKCYIFPAFIIGKRNFQIYDIGMYEGNHWWYLSDLINNYLEDSRIAFVNNLYTGSIIYSIMALEYAFKVKYCNYLDSEGENPDEYLNVVGDTLGSFYGNKDKYKNIFNDFNYFEIVKSLNELRNGLIHFNSKKFYDAIKSLGLVSEDMKQENSDWEIIFPNLVNEYLTKKVYNLVCGIIEFLFLPFGKRNMKFSSTLIGFK